MTRQTFVHLLKSTYNDFIEDKAMRLAAALAYYALFALGPVLIIIIAIAGFVWGRKAVQGDVVAQFSKTLGVEAAQQIEEIIKNANRSHAGIAATIIGVVALLVAATGLFHELKGALNTVWGVRLRRGMGINALIRDRLMSFGVLLVVAFMLLVTLVASTAIQALSRWVSGTLPMPPFVFQALELAVSFGVITMLFAAIFKWLPDIKVAWRDVWMGAAITALLFSIGKFGLGWYLGRSSMASIYGAAGSLIVILVWVYFASIVSLGGAEFTKVYARHRGSRIEPSPIAEFIEGRERKEQGIGGGATAAIDRPTDGMASPMRWRDHRHSRTPALRPRAAIAMLLAAAIADALTARAKKAGRSTKHDIRGVVDKSRTRAVRARANR